jgi:hypothetical protein
LQGAIRARGGTDTVSRIMALVRAFLEYCPSDAPGYFVEVGANHPHE